MANYKLLIMEIQRMLLSMGLFSLLLGCNGSSGPLNTEDRGNDAGRYMSAAEQASNRANQIAMVPLTMHQLRSHGVSDDSELRLEYFFYTDTMPKAESLASDLAARGYDGRHDISASDSNTFVITGWTEPMRMRDDVVIGWVDEMCQLASVHDCEFDGWGTHPTP